MFGLQDIYEWDEVRMQVVAEQTESSDSTNETERNGKIKWTG